MTNEGARNGTGQMHSTEQECWRCGLSVLYLHPKLCTLAGDYRAILCPLCVNDWTAYIRHHELITHLDDLLIRENQLCHAIIGDGIDRTSDMKKIRDERIELSERLFKVAEVWCSYRIDRSIPVRPQRSSNELREIVEAKRKRLIDEMDILSQVEHKARAEGAWRQ